jgi:hypothetical protein
MPTNYNRYKIQYLKIGSKFDGFKYKYNNRRPSNSTIRQKEKSTEKVVIYAAVDNSALMN